MEVGQYLFRPSSRDENHLTVAVKFYDDLIYEIEVEELDKANKYSLGKKLKLGNETYDDLNELGLRYSFSY
jgi:transcription elongation factor SPT6